MMPPGFWQRKSWQGMMLAPLGWLYGLAVEARFLLTKPKQVGIPVICIGNFTLGGTGKTPVAIYAAQRLKAMGYNPFFLTRGYGGSVRGAHRVHEKDDAATVGDEALLLARHFPVVVAGDRVAGAHLAVMHGAGVIVMDDGMQNPSLFKNTTLALVDAQNPFGNGHVFPAGPLRGFVNLQNRRVSAMLCMGGASEAFPQALVGKLQPLNGEWLKNTRVLGFCGIGKPEKFRQTLLSLGADIVSFRAYPDHYMFDGGDAQELIEAAAKDNLTLVTTEKDYVRLSARADTQAQLAGLANPLPVVFVPDDAEAFDAALKRGL